MKIVGTIEARMGSTRSPGKTLTEIYEGVSLLGLVCRRFRLCRNIDDVYVATTVESQDDPIAEWCTRNSVNYYRGSEYNVLDRVVKTSESARADAIVQMGADSAYLDYELIDRLVFLYRPGDYDFVCNDLELTYPLGIYGHVVSVSRLLEINGNNELTDQDREDVISFLLKHPENYRILNITAPDELAYRQLRLTVDYQEDIEQAQNVYSRLKRYDFKTSDIIELYHREPEIFAKTMNLIQNSAPFLRKKQ
jgi:spore coat polysaccharide biosynthesis protein SpsF